MEVARAMEILDPEHREHYESIEPVNEACRMGREALKKLYVAQKPVLEGDGYDENGELIYDTGYCPECNTAYEAYYEAPQHCKECGQKLDWSDIE